MSKKDLRNLYHNSKNFYIFSNETEARAKAQAIRAEGDAPLGIDIEDNRIIIFRLTKKNEN